MQEDGTLLDMLGHQVTARSLLELAANQDEVLRVGISLASKTGSMADIRRLRDTLLKDAKTERIEIYATP